MNIASSIVAHAHFRPDKPAIVFESSIVTYRQLNDEVAYLAAGLRSHGIRRGDRVAILLPNVPEFASIYFATVRLGAIAVSINFHLKPVEVGYILDDSGASIVFTTRYHAEAIGSIASDLACKIVAIDDELPGALSWRELLEAGESRAECVDCEPNDPAAVLYTSGTTGQPKGATLSHGNIISNANSFNFHCGVTADDRLILSLPLYHCFAQNGILNSSINAGATIVMHRQFNTAKVAQSLREDKITMFYGVPSNYIALYDAITREQVPNIKYYFSAAAPLPLTVANKWKERFGIVVNEGYGLTETSPFATYNHHRYFKPGSVGTPIQNVEVRIVSENNASVGTNLPGQIAIRGPNVMLGYWNRHKETEEVIKDGWFLTGDVGTCDEDGYIYIVDRIKDMINVGGMKVYPAEVEKVIRSVDSVSECEVFGVPDPIMGERVVAYIVAREEGSNIRQAISLKLDAALASYKIPSEIKIVPSLPKSSVGKVLKRVLRAEYKDPNASIAANKASLAIN